MREREREGEREREWNRMKKNVTEDEKFLQHNLRQFRIKIFLVLPMICIIVKIVSSIIIIVY